jgi:hypothetical protein
LKTRLLWCAIHPLLKRQGTSGTIVKTEQPTKYDKSVDANCTLDEYISSAYCSLPNESMLEEQWNAMPEAIEGKPLRLIWTGKHISVYPSKPVRFYMNRLTDVTGVSGTGRVVNGVILPSGKVVLEWKSPHQTIGIYDNFKQFLAIHVDSHPDSNEVVFID